MKARCAVWGWRMDLEHRAIERLRLAAEPGVTIAAQIQYDSSGEWETAETVTAGRMTPFYLAFPARRCDHFRLKFSADGPWRLWSVLAELYDGPYVRK